MRNCLLAFIIIFYGNTFLYGQLSDFHGTDFKKADSIAELYARHPLNDLKLLSDKLTRSLSTDVEKFRAIFKWVCLNIESDYALFVENKNMRGKLNGEKLAKWEKDFAKRVFSTMTAHHRTICTGYAYLVKELAFHSGMNCRIIDGYGRHAKANIGGSGVVNHSWNAIELAGKWYLCDPTWSSGTIDNHTQAFVRKFDDAYFLPEPSLFVHNHFPLDSKWILFRPEPDLHTFLNAPLVYIGSFRCGVEPVAPALFNVEVDRESDVFFQFTKANGDEPTRVTLYVENTRVADSFVRESCEGFDIYSTHYKFSKRGTYAVHVRLNGNLVLSYNARVR